MKKTIITIVAVLALAGFLNMSTAQRVEAQTLLEYSLIVALAGDPTNTQAIVCTDNSGIQSRELATLFVLLNNPNTRGTILDEGEQHHGVRPLNKLAAAGAAELNCDGLFGR